MRLRALLPLLAALSVSGCFRTVVRSGQPPAEAPESYDQRWHSGFVAGLIETSGPHAVDEACPEGWAEVRAQTDPLHTFMTLATSYIYSPQAVTVVCAEKGAPPAPPPAGYDVPALPSASVYPPPSASAFPPPPPPAREF